jgi:hypothetical protein
MRIDSYKRFVCQLSFVLGCTQNPYLDPCCQLGVLWINSRDVAVSVNSFEVAQFIEFRFPGHNMAIPDESQVLQQSLTFIGEGVVLSFTFQFVLAPLSV